MLFALITANGEPQAIPDPGGLSPREQAWVTATILWEIPVLPG
mgnify:CR=1 FL=1